MNRILIVSLIILVFFSCSAGNKKIETNPFFVYNFGGLENYTPKQQIDLLQKMGYDGICLRMAKAEHVDELANFILAAEKYPDFNIYSVFVRYNFQEPKVDRNRWREVVDIIQDKGIALWFIFGKPQPGVSEQNIEDILRNVVDYSARKNVAVTLYPHSSCYFYSTEQALPMVKKINHPNLKLAVHLCHEMRAGNANRMDEVVKNAAGYISFVTLSGADKEVDMTSPRTMDKSTIKPLGEGEYDLSSFLKALKEINYKGPVGFINFKIDEDRKPEEYLPESLKAWKALKKKYLKY